MFAKWTPRQIILLVLACTIPLMLCMVAISDLLFPEIRRSAEDNETIREVIYLLVGLLAGALTNRQVRREGGSSSQD